MRWGTGSGFTGVTYLASLTWYFPDGKKPSSFMAAFGLSTWDAKTGGCRNPTPVIGGLS
jgi:hypothetical protein